MKKLNMLLVAVLAMAMIIGFTGCKQESDASSAPSTVGTWERTEDDATMVLSAYSDNTWKLVAKHGEVSLEVAKGTYTGDATKDGEITIKVTHEMNDNDSNSLKELPSSKEDKCTIAGDTLKVPNSLFGESSSVVVDASTITFTRK